MAFLDEVGFSPSQPVTASWTLPGRRKTIPYENPQGRRLNALAALIHHGPAHSFTWDQVFRTLTAEDVLAFSRAIPRGGLPLVVVLDNASLHVSHVVKEALPDLAREGITLFYLPPYSPKLNDIEAYFLPPYSPKLNDIEAYFRGAKHSDLPERTYTTRPALSAAVDAAFDRLEPRLWAAADDRWSHQLRTAA